MNYYVEYNKKGLWDICRKKEPLTNKQKFSNFLYNQLVNIHLHKYNMEFKRRYKHY